MAHPPTDRPIPTRHRLTPAGALVVAATLWAAVARFTALSSLAPPAWFDEVWFALRARELLHGAPWRVFYPTSFGGANAGLVALTALVQALGFTAITSPRVVLAAAGVISVPLAYACFRELDLTPVAARLPLSQWERGPGGEVSAALAAVVLAYTLFGVILTRVGMESGIAPAAAMFIVWQALRGIQRRAWSGWLLAGFAAGLTQYNGLHARFALPLIAYLVLDALITARHGADRRRILLGALAMLGVALIVAAPLIAFFIREPEWFTSRAAIVARPRGVTWIDQLLTNLRLIARVWNFESSYDPKTTVPGIPLLDAVQTVGFWAGIGWALWKLPRRRAARVLMVWLIVMTLPSLLTAGAPNLQRMAGIAAPTAALVGIGWVWGYRWIAQAVENRTTEAQRHRGFFNGFLRDSVSLRFILPAAGSALLLTSIGWHTYLLFVRWPQVPILRDQFTAEPVDVAQDLLARAESQPVFAERAPEAEDVIAFEYLLADTAVRRLDFRKCLPMPHQRPTPTTYLVLTDRDPDTVGRLLDAYPGSLLPLRDDDLWQGIATLVEVPAGASAPPPAKRVEARFGSGIALVGYDASAEAVLPGETLFLTLYWHAAERVGADLTAFTHVGTGLDGSPAIAQRDGIPCDTFYPTSMWQPGEVVPDAFAITIPEDAPPGEYPLAVGWYAFPSLERLPLIDADAPLPDGRAVIGTVTVCDGS